jgi:Holliday junction resolvase RusA-like endonuclease
MIKLEIKPLSVNAAWQGRRFKTPEYKHFENDVSLLIMAQKPGKFIDTAVEVSYEFHIKNYLKTDVDNLVKPLQDVLVKKGIISDDRFIKKITAEKFKSSEDFINISIKEV